MSGRILLVSVVVGVVVIPLYAARDPRPIRGLRKALVWGTLFNLAYFVAAVFVYPRV